MIESKYWKEDLITFSKYLKKKTHFTRWSEKSQVNFEKQVVLHFFLIRKLIETNKITTALANKKYDVVKYRKTNRSINSLNAYNLEKQFEIENEIIDSKNITFLTNQLIHSMTLFGLRNGKKWDSVVMTSDYEKNKWLYEIKVSTIVSIMDEFGNNYPYKMDAVFDENKNDYSITLE